MAAVFVIFGSLIMLNLGFGYYASESMNQPPADSEVIIEDARTHVEPEFNGRVQLAENC